MSDENQKHGCVIVKSGRVLAMAFNKNRNIPANLGCDHVRDHASYHAERAAAKKVKPRRNLQGATVYIARVNNAGRRRYSRPCPECYAYLKRAGVKALVFTENEE